MLLTPILIADTSIQWGHFDVFLGKMLYSQEVASELKTSKLSSISEKQQLRIVKEAFTW